MTQRLPFLLSWGPCSLQPSLYPPSPTPLPTLLWPTWCSAVCCHLPVLSPSPSELSQGWNNSVLLRRWVENVRAKLEVISIVNARSVISQL